MFAGKRNNDLISHLDYKRYLGYNEEAEKERKFCHHDMGHFLDVARIAMILNADEEYGIEAEMIYAAALLHDIGRWEQYENGTDHAKASARLAGPILKDCGFSEKESTLIVSAIETHRDKSVSAQKDLSGLLYRADKLSRACFACKAESECNWKDDKKNLQLLM
ncbi:MAG: HD domain-containing protein [Lachnospiraceae bacterium]|nr:HD domain-containing protein [Lachnospiraceae bacterium]